VIRKGEQATMTLTHIGRRAGRGVHGRARGGRRGVLLLPLVILFTLVVGAVGYIGYVLWPRWPGPPVARDAPALPITIAGVAFNVPPAAMRVPVQRRPGAHERVDLSYLWPSLEPPDAAASAPAAAARTLDRLFVTIAAAGGAMPPTERVRTIYPRYAVTEPVAGPSGLAVLAFRQGTPYQGDDLIYDAAEPDRFLVRCSRNGAGPTPGTCLYERRIEAADLVVRFPRDWLNDWRLIAGSIEQLIRSLRPLPS
jgi:hypothetical protein